jgi:hypothetical protein
MPRQFRLSRRSVLKGLAGVALPLPVLDVMNGRNFEIRGAGGAGDGGG